MTLIKVGCYIFVATLIFLAGSHAGMESIRRTAAKHGVAEYVVGADGESKFQWVEVKHGE